MPTDEHAIIFVELVEWTATEHDYEQGEIGKEHTVLSESKLGIFDSFPDLAEALSRIGIPSVEDSGDGGYVFDDGGRARIAIPFTTDENNQIPSATDLKRWKAGKKKLYTAYVTVYVRVGTLGLPDARELSALTGLQEA